MIKFLKKLFGIKGNVTTFDFNQEAQALANKRWKTLNEELGDTCPK